MKRVFLNLSTLIFLCIAGCTQNQMPEMTVEKFNQIVSEPSDDAPLSEKLKALPFWTNFEAHVFLKYESGKTFQEDDVITAKTINGKYLVFTIESQLYKQPINSIVTYDEKSSVFKTFGKYNDTITEGITILDAKNKTYKTSSSYGDGFTESGTGSYSQNEESSQTLVYQNGTLILTREVKSQLIRQ